LRLPHAAMVARPSATPLQTAPGPPAASVEMSGTIIRHDFQLRPARGVV
jgi:hypothetical protein